jgi:hypothetical protein
MEISVNAPAGDLKVESLERGPDTDAQHSLSLKGSVWYRLRVHARGRDVMRDKVSLDPVRRLPTRRVASASHGRNYSPF